MIIKDTRIHTEALKRPISCELTMELCFFFQQTYQTVIFVISANTIYDHYDDKHQGSVFSIKMTACQYRNTHYKDIMVSQPNHLYHENTYTWKDKISFETKPRFHIDGLVQERSNSSPLAMELRLSCNNPSILSASNIAFGWFHAGLW